MDFKLFTPGGWEAYRGFGITVLGVVGVALVLRETLNLIRGRHPDYFGVLVRTGTAAILLLAVPGIAQMLGGLALEVGAVFDRESWKTLEKAIRVGLGSVQCDGVDWYDGLALLFSVRGLLLLMAFVVFIGFILVKIAVLDIGWKIMFSLVCLQAPLTLPLGALSEEGGVGMYWRNIISIAIWPITFSLVLALTSAAFTETITNIADGETYFGCTAPPVVDGNTTSYGEGTTDKEVLGWVKFVGIMLGLLMLTWKVPEISGMVVGGSPAGALGVGALGALTQSGARQIPSSGAVASAVSPQTGAAHVATATTALEKAKEAAKS